MVIPCYNEEEVLGETSARLREKYVQLTEKGLISRASRIVFVNDGSEDSTWDIITRLHSEEPGFFSGIDLAHNSGHQNAVLAGLMSVMDICDAAITMDADLQDDVEAIDEMLERFYEGNQVVYNHADFRLMSKRVLKELSGFKEVNLFLRGMVPLIGFKSCSVYYERKERAAGESKYPLRKMISFAVNGITSFSTKPLKFITMLGFFMSVMSVFAFIWAFVAKFCGFAELGWSSLLCSIWLIGGLQLFCLGIIGEYIGKIYAEVKHRPRFIVADFLNDLGTEFINTPGEDEKRT